MSCCEPMGRLPEHPNVFFEDGQITIYDRWGETQTFPDFDFCPWCLKIRSPYVETQVAIAQERPDHLARDPRGNLVARDWPSGPGSELTALILEQERRIEELQKPWDASSWISLNFSPGPLRQAARAGAAAQRGDLGEAEVYLIRAKSENLGLGLDETGAIRPREGFLRRVLKRLWPVGGRDTSRKAETR